MLTRPGPWLAGINTHQVGTSEELVDLFCGYINGHAPPMGRAALDTGTTLIPNGIEVVTAPVFFALVRRYLHRNGDQRSLMTVYDT